MRRNRLALLLLGALIAVFDPSAATAEIRLPAVIADNMVLQHDQPIPVWGWAEPGETVSVALAGQTVSTETNRQGRWRVTLPKLAPVADPLEMHGQIEAGYRDAELAMNAAFEVGAARRAAAGEAVALRSFDPSLYSSDLSHPAPANQL